MSDRIQREVEELLAKLDTFPPRPSPWRRVRDRLSRGLRCVGNIRLPNLTAGHVLLISIAVVVAAYVLIGGTNLGTWIIAGGILAFIAAFVFSLRRQSRPPEKYWRDRPLDLGRPGGPRGRSWWDRWRHR